MIFSAKSKTFLVGEYAVLFGGSAVLLATEPEFKLLANKTTTGESLAGVSNGSAAHKFYLAHKNIFKNLSIKFVDPFNGAGGLGASSAQFVLLYKLYLYLNRCRFDINSFLEEYKTLAAGKAGSLRPSGADCLTQYYNHNIYFNSHDGSTRKIEWSFPNLDFAIFRTGFKVATHEHLRELRYLDISELREFSSGVLQSFVDGDERSLVKNIHNFFNVLKKMQLTLEHTSDLVEKFLKLDGVLAAKGCGAMGADTIIAIFSRERKDSVRKAAKDLGLIPVN
jgi:mevalonate kinase